MNVDTADADRDLLVRAVVAVVLGLVALGSLLRGKRLRGLLAGAGAVALGYTVTSSAESVTESIGLEPAGESADLQCAVCGEPIRPGQPRGPDEEGNVVHDACR